MLGNGGNDGCGGFCFVLFFYFLIWVFGSGRILVGNGGSGGHGGGVVVIGLFDIFFNEFAGFVSRFFFFLNLGFWFRWDFGGQLAVGNGGNGGD